MAKDDMTVIIYKILRYLYRVMKEGKKPEINDIYYNCKLFSISTNYWNQIMIELIDNGYIRGFSFCDTKSGLVPLVSDSAGITLKGVQFLEENSQMQKVKEFLGNAFEITLDVMIALL